MPELAHLHRCRAGRLGGPEEQCPELFVCTDACVEDEQETLGFCAKHQALADDLERLIENATHS